MMFFKLKKEIKKITAMFLRFLKKSVVSFDVSRRSENWPMTLATLFNSEKNIFLPNP